MTSYVPVFSFFVDDDTSMSEGASCAHDHVEGYVVETCPGVPWRSAADRDSAQRFHSDLSPRGLEPLWREEERRRKWREGMKGDFPTSN